MEALCLVPPQHQQKQPLLRPKLTTNPSSQAPSSCTFRTSKTKPFVSAAASKSTLEIPLKPAFPLLSKPLPNPPTLLLVSPDSLQYEQGKVGAVPDRVAAEGDVNAMEYLTSILVSKVYDVAVESPLELATKLSDRLGVKVWLKREDIQPSCLALIHLRELLRGFECLSEVEGLGTIVEQLRSK